MRKQRNPHLAIEALRRLVEQEMRAVTKHNIVKQRSFAERLEELKYGYPPDAEADAIKRVLDQMETFADDWSPQA